MMVSKQVLAFDPQLFELKSTLGGFFWSLSQDNHTRLAGNMNLV